MVHEIGFLIVIYHLSVFPRRTLRAKKYFCWTLLCKKFDFLPPSP